MVLYHWLFLIYFVENVRNLGAHTLLLQVVLNESGNTVYSGKELPSHKIKFNVTGMSFIVNLLVLPHIE